jgi:hypothetical protein
MGRRADYALAFKSPKSFRLSRRDARDGTLRRPTCSFFCPSALPVKKSGSFIAT